MRNSKQNIFFSFRMFKQDFFLLNNGAHYGHRKMPCIVTFALNSPYFARHSEAVFLVMCDPSMNELWAT
jgi:hypothetical protein